MTDKPAPSVRAPATWCLLAALLFGASTPVAKVLLEGFGPFTLAGLFYLGAALAVAPATFSGGSVKLAMGRRNLLLLSGAVVFGGVIGPVLLLLSLQRASASSVSLWLNLETVGTAILAWLFFKEDMGARTWLAAALVVAGGAALALPPEPETLTAVAFVAGAALCWGLDNNLTSLIDGFTPAQSTLVKGAVAGMVNLGIGLSVEGVLPLQAAGTGMLVMALVVGGLGYGVSLVLYVRGAQHLGATRSQLLFAAAPFFGLLLSWAALGEEVLFVQLAAGGIMALGIVVMMAAPHMHHHVHFALQHTHSHRHDDDHHDHVHEGLPSSHRHTHEHEHEPKEHSHPHRPDLHHRHEH